MNINEFIHLAMDFPDKVMAPYAFGLILNKNNPSKLSSLIFLEK